MPNEKVYIVTLMDEQYRPGEPAEIVGVEMVIEADKETPCFRLRYEDGEEKLAPLDAGRPGLTHCFVSESDVRAGDLPEVWHGVSLRARAD